MDIQGAGDSKTIWTVVGAALMLGSVVPYLWAMFKRRIRPHVFSWFIWGLINLIVFFAQRSEGGGGGAYVTLSTAVINFMIVAYSLRHGEKNITRSDWIVFILALMALPVWQMTQNALYAVLVICVIDLLAFWPTVRKSWLKPFEEATVPFLIGGVGFGCGLLALDAFTLTTALYPALVLTANMFFVAMVLYRRKVAQP